jgi:hypothetical protein
VAVTAEDPLSTVNRFVTALAEKRFDDARGCFMTSWSSTNQAAFRSAVFTMAWKASANFSARSPSAWN